MLRPALRALAALLMSLAASLAPALAADAFVDGADDAALLDISDRASPSSLALGTADIEQTVTVHAERSW